MPQVLAENDSERPPNRRQIRRRTSGATQRKDDAQLEGECRQRSAVNYIQSRSSDTCTAVRKGPLFARSGLHSTSPVLSSLCYTAQRLVARGYESGMSWPLP